MVKDLLDLDVVEAILWTVVEVLEFLLYYQFEVFNGGEFLQACL